MDPIDGTPAPAAPAPLDISSMSAEAFMAHLQAMTARTKAGDAAAAAAALPTPASVTPVAQPTVIEKAAGAVVPEPVNKTVFVDPLRKSFERLAKMNPSWGKLASAKALDDPAGFLHERDPITKRYKISDAALDAMAQALLLEGATGKNQGEGVPMAKAYGEAHASNIERGFESALSRGVFDGQTKGVLDTTFAGNIGGGALIRVDIEPILYEAYVRRFPLLDVIRTIPSNGLVHTYDVRTSPGTASNIGELGDLSTIEQTSTIERRSSSNIAVIATKRGLSLKLQFAVMQSGMNFPVTGSDNLEVVGGLIAIGNREQANVLQGNFSTAAKTLDDEEGLTDTNSTDGYRTLLKGASTSATKTAGDKYRDMINKATASLMNAGGSVEDLVIVMSTGIKQDFAAELIDFLRIVNNAPGGGFPTDLLANGFVGINDMVDKIIVVPSSSQGSGIGYYDIAGPSTVEDIYISDLMGCALAYLGSPTPTVLELPVGYNNTLSNVFIPFKMSGFVMQVPAFHRKVRCARKIV
jgi:hypothetical protein